jgi:glycosyltransferase involved in cell wall biosynthesis
MNVLHITPAFYPATIWGGPIFSTFSLCNALHNIDDINLMVLTTNTAGRNIGNNISHSEILQTNIPFSIKYCQRIAGVTISIELLKRLRKEINWADVVHLTAVYSFPTIPALLLSRVLKKPTVWSPHGSLQRWKNTTKPFLKSFWECLCNAIVDPKICIMHVTSLQEEIESKSIYPDFTYRIIPNGVEIPDDVDTDRPRPLDMLRILYIGRIHPIKGIENLLLGLRQLTDIDFSLTICGTGNAKYLDRIKALCKFCKIEDKINFTGHLEGHKKKEAFFNSDVCVVPSFTENFGMVIAEALSYGVPVICSKRTPWSDISIHRCGIWTDNDPNSLANAIRNISSMDIRTMGQRGRQWMMREFNWTKIAENMFKLYQEVTSIKRSK